MKKQLIKGTLEFRVDTPALLHEIANAGLPRTMGVLKIPLNIFKNLLGQVAIRATELDDPKLNILMLNLGLYEISPHDIINVIEQQKNRMNVPSNDEPNYCIKCQESI